MPCCGGGKLILRWLCHIITCIHNVFSHLLHFDFGFCVSLQLNSVHMLASADPVATYNPVYCIAPSSVVSEVHT